MEEIKVKAYGLINFTKKQYVITQAIVLAIAIVIVIVTFAVELPQANMIIRNIHWLALFTLVGEAIETILMLKKFGDRKEEILMHEKFSRSNQEIQNG